MTLVINSDDEGPSPSKYKAGGQGIQRPLGKHQKSHKVPAYNNNARNTKQIKPNEKKKDLPVPFDNVLVDFRNLNKRKQEKVKGFFSNLVKGANKGALKGSKGKKKK